MSETENQNAPESQVKAENEEKPEAGENAAVEEKKDSESKGAETETQSTEEIQDAAEDQAAKQEAPEQPPVQIPLAPRCENPIIGRKIFFVNPPLYVENYVQPALKLNEYEAYVIKDYKYTKNALRRFPDALCFIFIDDELSYDGWFNYILSFQQDEKLKTIFVGLMSAMIPNPVREKFMMNLSLPGGFIMLNETKGAALIEKIIGILELNGAKGRRKYIRLDCDENIKINGYFANQSQLLQVSIANISSVGFTCYYPRSYGAALAAKMIVPSFSITLGRRSVATPSVVFDVKAVDENNYFAVLLFLKQVGPDDRKVIKNFIFEHLVERIDKLIYSEPPDIDDYFGKGGKAEEPASDENAEKVEDAEEVVEEAEEVKEGSKEEKKDGETENKEASEKSETSENGTEEKKSEEGNSEQK